jgi:hypothetical protein
MKPKLKPPGTKRSKLEYDIPLSSFAFKFNLRRYNLVSESELDEIERVLTSINAEVRRYTMSKQSALAASPGALVHYEQTVSTRRIHGCTGTS